MSNRVLIAIVFLFVVAGCSSSEAPPAPKAEEKPVAAKPTKETACDDGVDDDGDGTVDCKDRDCAPTTVCAIARCKEVCVQVFECGGIKEACTDEELVGVLAGCQKSCADEDTRGQLSMADGVPCFVIEGAFLERVQGQGICVDEESSS